MYFLLNTTCNRIVVMMQKWQRRHYQGMRRDFKSRSTTIPNFAVCKIHTLR